MAQNKWITEIEVGFRYVSIKRNVPLRELQPGLRNTTATYKASKSSVRRLYNAVDFNLKGLRGDRFVITELSQAGFIAER